MTKIEDIEKAISELAPDDFERLSAWFEEFQAARFDARIERDVRAGKLDQLADEALAEHRAGRTRQL